MITKDDPKNNIFIKPNLVDSYSPRSGIITSLKIIEAIILYFQKFYPDKKIVIGDGCALHSKMGRVLEKSGYGRLADRYGVEIADIDEAERKEFEWEYGVLNLPQYLLTHEYINVPKRIRPSDTPINSSLPCALTT